MSDTIATGAVNHIALTVTDLPRAEEFYTGLLGFRKLMDLSPTRILLVNEGGVLLALTLPPDPDQAPTGDRFNENRVGLDHLSLSVGSRADLEAALQAFDEMGISHGEVKDLGPALPIYVLAFRDPDNMQIELTAAYA